MPYLYVCEEAWKTRARERVGDEKRNRDKVHLREAMVEAAESEGDEEAHGSLRECDREKIYGGLRAQVWAK